jgi:hypothetical protein
MSQETAKSLLYWSVACFVFQVSATDPDCGVNAMVNYTLGDSFGKLRDFEVRSGSGEVCIAGELDFETRSMYEFPVIATDRGKQITISGQSTPYIWKLFVLYVCEICKLMLRITKVFVLEMYFRLKW